MNKKLALSMVFMLLASCSKPCNAPSSSDGSFKWLSNYEEAVEMSGDEGRNLLIEFSTSWCPYCKYIEENVFNKKESIEELSKFVLLSVNGDKKENQALMDKFDVKGFPTFIALTPSGKELLRFNELGSSSEFISIIGKIETEKEAAAKEEEALAGELDKLAGEKAALRKAALTLIDKFPDSARLPVYYDKLASTYSSKVLKDEALKRSVSLVEKNISNIRRLGEAERWMVLDRQIDLAAGIYKELGMFARVKDIYLRAGSICEKDVWARGGIKKDHYLINYISHYYLSAGAFGKAELFMRRAMKEDPKYWPIHAGLAKALLAANKTGEAASFAKEAYALAEEVAKPKAAMIWAECYAAKNDLVKAIEILQSAKNELQRDEGSKYGRALKISGLLDERMSEYKNAVR